MGPVGRLRRGIPLHVTGAGLDATLHANLDRLGPRWPLGRVTVGAEPTTLTVTGEDPLLAPATAGTAVRELTATPAGDDAAVSVVPLRQACGRYVDWYQTS